MTNFFESGERTQETSVVLDASALLCLVLEEPGADIVDTFLRRGATISAINLAEVVTRLTGKGLSEDQIEATLIPLTFTVAELRSETAWQAGILVRETRHLGLSLGDRCCLALAQQLRLQVLTTDRKWSQLDIGVEVVVCR